MAELREVCCELDMVLIEMMASLQNYWELRRRHGAALSEGYFNMSQARYAMGAQTVSCAQYDAVMNPLVHIEIHSALPSSNNDQEAQCEFIVKRQQLPSAKIEASCKKAVVTSVETTLRQRKPGGSQVDDGTTVTRVLDKDRTMEGEEPKDPLKWFGILVPRSLRQSQQNFIQAINICAELASAQAQLETLRKRFLYLLQKKQLQ